MHFIKILNEFQYSVLRTDSSLKEVMIARKIPVSPMPYYADADDYN